MFCVKNAIVVLRYMDSWRQRKYDFWQQKTGGRTFAIIQARMISDLKVVMMSTLQNDQYAIVNLHSETAYHI